MIPPVSKISFADLAALATLANARLAPATPYQFNPFAGKDQISLPPDFTALADYSTGSFGDSAKITFRLYAYKTIAGKKTYTWAPLRKAFTGATGAGTFSLTWTWVSPVDATAPEGYLVVLPLAFGSGFHLAWRDIGNVQTFTEDGTFSNPAWKFDTTLDADNGLVPADNIPVGFRAWLKVLNQIHNDLFTGMDLFGGAAITFTDDFLLSGPWCVSVAPKCYLTLGSAPRQPCYKNLAFLYSEADSLTGNQIAPEADLLATYIGVVNGANNFNWDVAVKVNGRLLIFSNPGQSESDWVVAASHPGITISFDANYFDSGFLGVGRTVTAFIFDFVDVQYTVGTPIVLTTTPPPGEDVINPGNPNGAGGRVDAVFTGDAITYATTDTIAIHLADIAAKSAALPSTLAPVTFTSPAGGTNVLESHHRTECPGVFTANTLPTLGLMTYLDVDLPQYSPQPDTPFVASTRRTPRKAALPYMEVTANKGALWPVYRDTDFTPDSVVGKAVKGSVAWQKALATKNVRTINSTDDVPPYEPAEHLFNLSLFVPAGAAEVRFLAQDPAVTLYVKANSAPTLADFDASAPGGTWLSLADSVPGFVTNTTWFYGLYNPTSGQLSVATIAVRIDNATAPNGTFFPTGLDDDNNPIPNNEGLSYHFSDPSTIETRPIPLSGYCVSSLTLRRQPVANASGEDVSPSTSTADLAVKIGIMLGYGYEVAGVFTEIQTVTIPAGQAFVRVPVFLPVLAGTPLAYQSTEIVAIMATVNFQPMMHSTFAPATAKVFGADAVIGYYNGPAWFNPERALLFFKGGDESAPTLLPLDAVVYNDLTAALNLL